MNICLVGTQASSTLNFRRALIECLAAQGHRLHVFATDHTAHSRAELERLGAQPQDWRIERQGLNILDDLRAMRQLQAAFARIRPDVVFAWFAKPAIWATLAARRAGVPRVVAMLEGLGYAFSPGLSLRDALRKAAVRAAQVALYRRALPRADALVFLNRDDPADLLTRYRIPARSVQVLGGIGVDLMHFAPTPPPVEPMRFVFAGRLLVEKGVREFAAAARMLRPAWPQAEFVLLGSLDAGNPGSLPAQELEAWCKEGSIIHPGHVDDVRPWLRAASVFVLPSWYREGVPRSTQEAMAMGRVVITTDVPGCRDSVRDGMSGFLVPARDAAALADKMHQLLECPAKVRIMGAVARKHAEINFCAQTKARMLAHLLLGQPS